MYTSVFFLLILIGGSIAIFILTIKFLGNIAGVILGIFLVIIYAQIVIMLFEAYAGG